MKNFFKNRDNLIIIGISILAFIVGILAIGPVLSVLIIGIADISFFLPNILKRKKGKSPKPKKKSSKKEKQEKRKKKKVIKILLIIFLICCALVIAGCIFFAGYIVSTSPKFSPKKLYKQEATILYKKNGEILDKLGTEKREKISYDELPEVLVDAIIATEDSRFFQHNGFDLARFLKASVQQVLTGGGGGASTLTMQVVKNTFTSTTSTGFEGIKRKFTDIYMAIYQVEKKYTKEEIIEFYVNAPYLGSGTYGVEQACQTYFGKSAKDINLAEAALIAGLFQAPNAYDPYQYPEKAEQRRNQVLNLMERHGYITSAEKNIAKSMSVESLLHISGDDLVERNNWQAFIDTVIAEVIQDTKSDENPNGLDPALVPMEIYTTIDTDIQAHINSIMDGETFNWPNEVVTGGIAVVDVHTGEIKAIGGGRNKKGERTFNMATQNTRQIGSTSKPLFDYAPGIEFENWSTYQLFADEPYSYSNGTGISNWDRNYNGLMTMRTALGQSRNIPALKAFQTNKNSNILKFIKSVGLHPEVSDNMVHESHSIGGYSPGETPLTMAAAYATFGNGGYYIKPHSYTKIIYRDTNETVENKPEKTRVMSEETAYMMTNLLQTSAQLGLGNQSYVNGAIYGAKTGTSNFDEATINAMGYGPNAVNDLWVNGVSPDYAISVWYGYDKRNKDYVSTSFTITHRLLFQAVARGVFKTGSDWARPDGVIEVEVEMDSWPVKLPSEYTPNDLRITELFKVGTEPTEISDRYSKLEDVTNLTASVKDNTLTLKWKGITTPNAISNDYLSNYMSSLYSNEDTRASALANRINYNNSYIGNLVYKIYSKDNNGNLKFIKETNDTQIDIPVDTTSPTTYVIKSAYTIFTANMSDGVETKISLANVKGKVSAKFIDSIKENEKITKNKTYNVSSKDVKVFEDSKDVTSSAAISIKIDGKDNGKLDTSIIGTHKIVYTIKYDNQTITLTRTIEVVETTN